ncbi:MAG: protein phosphatase 2C domain-containing protein [Eggerthellaceae bacterium]|nr:protein phosphatase 2C domain-containing protein [Eggerthellaceae bacterium]
MSWDICTVRGQRDRNEDYALFGEGIGACVADGIGGAPLGDAIARCACHAALSSLEAGSTPFNAMRDACFCVDRMIRDLELQGSGAALTVVKFHDRHVEAAWMGDVAFCVAEGSGVVKTNFDELDLCGPKITQCVGAGECNPHFVEFDVASDAKIALCTDGVWKEIGKDEIVRRISAASSPQEATARLVLGRKAHDNATALVLFPEAVEVA